MRNLWERLSVWYRRGMDWREVPRLTCSLPLNAPSQTLRASCPSLIPSENIPHGRRLQSYEPQLLKQQGKPHDDATHSRTVVG